jgi:hypothetical protein
VANLPVLVRGGLPARAPARAVTRKGFPPGILGGYQPPAVQGARIPTPLYGGRYVLVPTPWWVIVVRIALVAGVLWLIGLGFGGRALAPDLSKPPGGKGSCHTRVCPT